jgi:acetate kinase
MKSTGDKRILTINSGSSSLKMALYAMADHESLMLRVAVERIGRSGSQVIVSDDRGQRLVDPRAHGPSQKEALQAALEKLHGHALAERVDAVSHRIVHGGPRYVEPQRITPTLIAELRTLAPIDPDHLPQAINDIKLVSRRFPGVPQFGCFDTAFHRTMPRVAQICPLPGRYFSRGILRYGFHGISYEYILSELRVLEGDVANQRVVAAHLGSGASMAAIRGGRSVDTTMGFSPTSGLLMGTRTGDVDPGVLMYLLKQEKQSFNEIDILINKHAGLLGVSGVSAHMEDLLATEEADSNAADAIALFCNRAKKYLGAYVAILGGLDILVFTAGIGEHSPVIRERICQGLEFLGICIDPARNAQNAPLISRDDSRVKVRVMKTDENLMLARHAARLMGQSKET